MPTLFKKYSTPILISLLLALLVLAWLFPSAGLMLGIIFLLLCLVIASLAVLEKHREAYLQGKITRAVYMRTVFYEITGILLAMILAGLLGRYIAEIATHQINHDLTRVIAGIIVGLLVGISVGILVRRTWGRLVKVSTEK